MDRCYFHSIEEVTSLLEGKAEPEQIAAFTSLLRPCFGLYKHSDGAKKRGSHFGGLPEMPETMEWPLGEDDRPLPFVAQVDLGDISGIFPPDESLPDRGRLLFFVDLEISDPSTLQSSCCVIWDQSPLEELRLRTYPEDESIDTGYFPRVVPYVALDIVFQFRMTEMFSLEFVLNSQASDLMKDRKFKSIIEALNDAYDNREFMMENQLLGAPKPIQDDPRMEIYYNIRYTRDKSLSKNKNDNELDFEYEDYVLLMQLCVEDCLSIVADGVVYFLIRRDDLRSRKFNNVISIFQST